MTHSTSTLPVERAPVGVPAHVCETPEGCTLVVPDNWTEEQVAAEQAYWAVRLPQVARRLN